MGLEVALALLGIGDAVSLVLYDRVGQPDLLVGGFGPVQGSQDTGVGKVDLLGADPALVGLGHQGDSPLRVFHRCPRLALCEQCKANLHLAPHLADRQRALPCDTHGFAGMLQRAGEITPWFGSRRGGARRELSLGAGQGSQPGRQALLAFAVSGHRHRFGQAAVGSEWLAIRHLHQPSPDERLDQAAAVVDGASPLHGAPQPVPGSSQIAQVVIRQPGSVLSCDTAMLTVHCLLHGQRLP